MPRAKIWGYISMLISLLLGAVFLYSIILIQRDLNNFVMLDLHKIPNSTFYAVATPLSFVSFFVLGTGFWIGWTILSIKVVPPMPEIVEKKDFSKIKAFLLCMITLAIASLLAYGLYIRSFWALAIPSAVISFVILGAIFWVGIAIITTRVTLPEDQKES